MFIITSPNTPKLSTDKTGVKIAFLLFMRSITKKISKHTIRFNKMKRNEKIGSESNTSIQEIVPNFLLNTI